MPRALAPTAAVALLLALLALPALAQVPGPQVTLALAEPALRLDANGTATVEATVTYADAVPGAQGTVTLRVDAPDGWTVVVEPAPTFPMAPGESETVTLTVLAPPAATGAEAGDATLHATVAAGPGRPSGSASATLGLTRVDPVPPPPPDRTPLVVAALAALVLAGAGTGVAIHRRRKAREAADRAAWLDRETGILVEPAGPPLPFGDRREVAVRVRVKNASARPRVALVEVKAAPPGWLAAVNVPRRELQPGEEMTVTLTARPPPGAPIGDAAQVVLAARPEEAREWDERVTLDVQAPAARATPTPRLGYRPGFVPRRLRR